MRPKSERWTRSDVAADDQPGHVVTLLAPARLRGFSGRGATLAPTIRAPNPQSRRRDRRLRTRLGGWRGEAAFVGAGGGPSRARARRAGCGRDPRGRGCRARRSCCRPARAGEGRARAGTRPRSAATFRPAARPADGTHVEYWIGAVPTTWNVVPNGHRPDARHDVRPGEDDDADGDLPPLHAPTGKRQLPPADYGLVGPLIQAQVGDTIVVHFKNFDPEQPALDALPRRALRRSTPTARTSRASRAPGADVKPGADLHLPAARPAPTRRACGPTTTTRRRWTTSITGGLYGALSIRARAQRKPDREFVVFFEKQLELQHDRRPRVHRQHADVPRQGRRRRAVGRARLGDDHHSFHVHGHRWMTADGPRDVQTVEPGRVVRLPLEGGQGRDVALPLPRRGAHDERDDRPLRRHEVARRETPWRRGRRYSAAHGCAG